jgi:hypothetical protein
MIVVEAPSGRRPKTYPDKDWDAIKVKFVKKIKMF